MHANSLLDEELDDIDFDMKIVSKYVNKEQKKCIIYPDTKWKSRWDAIMSL